MPYATCNPATFTATICQRTGSDSISSLVSLLERMGTTALLAQALQMAWDDSQSKHARKVLVMGASVVKEDKLRSIARKEGYGRDVFEYLLDYNKIDRRSIDRLRHSDYDAIIVGPMHHSIRDMGDASSAIQELKDHPDIYPPVIEARDSHTLKITNNSFKKALEELGSLLAA